MSEKARKLLEICEKYIRDQEICSDESIYQNDGIALSSLDFIKEVCDVVGYFDDETGEIYNYNPAMVEELLELIKPRMDPLDPVKAAKESVKRIATKIYSEPNRRPWLDPALSDVEKEQALSGILAEINYELNLKKD